MTQTRSNQLANLRECGDLIPHPVCALDRAGKLIYANQQMLDMAALTSARLKTLLTQPDFDKLRTFAIDSQLFQQSQSIQLRLQFGAEQAQIFDIKSQPQLLNGAGDSMCILALTPVPALDAGGSTSASKSSCAIASDNLTSAALKTESSERPAESETKTPSRIKLLIEQLRSTALAESLPHFVWCCDEEVGCTYANGRMSEYSGWPKEYFSGKKWFDMLHPDDRERTLELWKIAMSGSAIYSIEHRLRAADGSYRWFNSRASAILDTDGSTRLWLGTSTDIHEQVLAKDELEQAVRALDREAERRRRTDRKLETQYAVSAVLAISKSLQEAAPNILLSICETLGWDWGGIWTAAPDETPLRFVYLADNDKTGSGPTIPEQLLKNAQEFVTSIFTTNRPAWISRSPSSDATKQNSFPHFESGSALALPVMSEH